MCKVNLGVSWSLGLLILLLLLLLLYKGAFSSHVRVGEHAKSRTGAGHLRAVGGGVSE